MIEGWTERGARGLEGLWEPEIGLYLDHDLLSGELLRACTIAGFAPLVAGHVSPERLGDLLDMLDSPAFMGNPRLHRPLPPSTSPEDPGFHPRSYWRGPTWPVFNWLLWWSLNRAGESERAEQLRRASLAQLAEGGFGEYFDPFSGRSLGSTDQSWTAAVALDWLASGAEQEVWEAA